MALSGICAGISIVGCAVMKAGFPALAVALADEFLKIMQQDDQVDGLTIGACKALVHIIPAVSRYEELRKFSCN